jgi:hypothetical protein
MTDDRLPIVFKAGLRIGLMGFVFSAMSAFVAYEKLSDQFPSPQSVYHLFEIDGRTVGWLCAAFAVVLACFGLLTIVRGCPRLILDETGISFSRCFGSPVRISWSRYQGIGFRRAVVPNPRRSTVVDIVYVKTTDGQWIDVGSFWKASVLEDAIRRATARMKSGEAGSASG